uniref:HECT domain-containing protein n=1 Tax=Amphilophus citrinellus TaxID=61819 RepID=A0A3Q0R9L2_AMPCI
DHFKEMCSPVSQSTTREDLEKSKEPLLDYLANDLLIHDIVMFQVIHRVQGPFHRFCEGLKTLGVLEKIRSHPESFRPLFCYEPRTLTADQVDDLFSIHLSPEGSNKRAEEGPSKLQKILAFATGATAVPPIGFSPAHPLSLFIKEMTISPMHQFSPLANTCVNCMRLPLHVSYQFFKEKFDFALGNTYGFGRV